MSSNEYLICFVTLFSCFSLYIVFRHGAVLVCYVSMIVLWPLFYLVQFSMSYTLIYLPPQFLPCLHVAQHNSSSSSSSVLEKNLFQTFHRELFAIMG